MIVAVIIFGLLFGSFLNVVIYRMQRKQSIVYPSSHCPACTQPILFYDNIPVLSYLILRGRCRRCGAPISIRYPLVEALTAVCLAALYFRFGLSSAWGLYSILVLFLIPIAFIDLDVKLVLNRLVFPGAIIGIFYQLVFHVASWKVVALGAVSGGILLLLIAGLGALLFKKQSLGMGDVKLIVFIGVYVGFPAVLYCFFFSVLAAAVYIIIGLLARKIEFGDTIPFGPFLAIGTFGYLLAGAEVLSWYTGLYS
jgi:leader peptidase (prepilin peptidase) / N-methyltransferase